MFIKRLSEESLVIGAPAKVNLFLEVLGKRPDGYHNINSLFQAVSLFDRLRFYRTNGPGVTLEFTTDCDLPTNESNLISMAYDVVKHRHGISGGLRVELEKNIPIAAGLAGGSADAAATIVACNILFDLGLSRDHMTEIGLEVGSDLPFFFTQGQAIVRGRGEVIEEVSLPTDYWLLLITPNFGISTAKSYGDLKRDLTKPKNPIKLSRCAAVEELVAQLSSVGNDFEEVHLQSHPVLGRLKNGLIECGAMLARLTGSGPTMFGIFNGVPNISRGDNFRQGDWQIHTVMPISLQLIDRHDVGGNRGDNRD